MKGIENEIKKSGRNQRQKYYFSRPEYKDTKWIQWVVSRTYDETQPENQKWDSGVYFDSLTDAVNYATGKFLKQ